MKEKIKGILNKILNSEILVVCIFIILFIKTIIFYKNTIAIANSIETATLLGSVYFLLILSCVLFIMPNKARIIVGIITNLIISLLLFVDNVYYIFANNVISVAQITNLQYGEQIMATLPSLLEGWQLFYFLDLIILTILLITKILKIEKQKELKREQKIIKISVGVVGAVILYFSANEYIEKGALKSYNRDLQIAESTIYGYHISDIANYFNYESQTKYKDYQSMEEDYVSLKGDYEEKYGESNYNFQGILKDKNLIILQLESIQEFLVNTKINGQEITPNLNEFLNENIEFSNMHMQSYSTTADSEYTMITSTYPMENGMSFSRYYTNYYDDIFTMFNSINYNTSFMHGNFASFWNRGNVYKNYNLDEMVFKTEFEDTSENINGDLSDELLYKQAITKIKQYGSPFMTNIVSASSHTPFTLNGIINKEQKVNIDVGKYKNTYFGDYLEAANYADYAFGLFINGLKQEGLYDDTAILVFGDHNGLTMYDTEMVDFLTELDPNINDIQIKLNYTRVLCGMKIPGVNDLEIEKPVNKLDIKPTMAYLYGVNDGFSLGTNMFGNKDFVALNNERIITDKCYFDEEWYLIENGKLINMMDLSKEEAEMLDFYYKSMKTELDISNSININNLLAKQER